MKKVVAIMLAVILCFSVIGCVKENGGEGNINLTEAQMIQSLNKLASEIEKSQNNTGNNVSVEFKIENDNSCKMIMTYNDSNENNELILAEAKTIQEMFDFYRENGFITEGGEIVGFTTTTINEREKPMTPQEVLESTELSGEDNTIAGFPGEGSIDVGSVPIEFPEN